MNRTSLFIAALSITLFAAVPHKVLGQQNITTPYIEVTGNAEKKIAPDRIFLDIEINENDYKNKSIIDIEKNMIEGLSKMGIDTKKDLVIKDLASNFKYYFLKGNNPKLMKEYQLLTRDAAKAGEVIVMLQSIGISRTSINRAENSKIEEYKNDVRVQAVKNAKEKAILLTEAIDQNIGKAIFISEQNYGTRNYALSSKAMMVSDSSQGYSAPDIAFEEITLESSVIVRFELK